MVESKSVGRSVCSRSVWYCYRRRKSPPSYMIKMIHTDLKSERINKSVIFAHSVWRFILYKIHAVSYKASSSVICNALHGGGVAVVVVVVWLWLLFIFEFERWTNNFCCRWISTLFFFLELSILFSIILFLFLRWFWFGFPSLSCNNHQITKFTNTQTLNFFFLHAESSANL